MRRFLPLLAALGLLGAACSSSTPTDAPVAATAEVEIPGQPPAQTHGGDPVPPPKPSSLVGQVRPEAAWPCESDGQNGRRVQLLHVHAGPADTTALRPTFEGIIRHVEGTFLTSARKTGGERLVRFVTSPTCVLNIASVTVSANAIASFDQMISELSAQGYNRTDRIYHSWVEGAAYCGIGTVYTDDSPTSNINEQFAQYSRSDRQCWDYAEAHELTHNLGGVQNSAPNSTGGLHSRDEHDVMSYADGAPKGQMIQPFPCPDATNEDLLDCRNDDYFSTAPSGYLSTHWNTANASALSRGAVSTTSTTAPPVPTTSTTSTTVPPTTSTTTGKGKTATSLILPKTIRSGEPFTAFAIVSGDCKPSGTVGFYVSGRLMSRQVLNDGLASVTLTIQGTTSRPTFRADYDANESCAKSRATARKAVG